MAGPWEQFQQQQAVGPWQKFQAPEQEPQEPSQSLNLPVPGTFTPPEPVDPDFGSRVLQTTSGVNEGLAMAAGFPVDAANMLLGGGANIINRIAGTNLSAPDRPVGGSQFFTEMLKGAGTIAEPLDDPLSRGLRRVGQEVGATTVPAFGPASQVARAGLPATQAARQIGGMAATALGSGGGAAIANELAPDNPYADLAGQILGATLVTAGPRLARKVITPNPAAPHQTTAAQTMRQEGVDLTAGQATGNRGLRYTESELGGVRAQDFTAKQTEQFTQAALARIGVRASRATPEALRRARNEIGEQFNMLSRNNTLVPDAKLQQDVIDLIGEYQANVPPSARRPIVTNFAQDIVNAAKNGAMDGTEYQKWRSRFSSMAASGRDDDVKDAFRGLANALDDAMERSIAQNNPQLLGDWQNARQDWRNLLIVEKSVARAGEQAVSGIITPANLRSAVQSTIGKTGYVQGAGELNELARAGVQTMTPLPDSGTAGRLMARSGAQVLPGVAGGTVGATLGASMGPAGMVAGGVAGGVAANAIPQLAGRAVLSNLGRRYLSNQRLGAPASALEALLQRRLQGPAISAIGQQNQQNQLPPELASLM